MTGDDDMNKFTFKDKEILRRASESDEITIEFMQMIGELMDGFEDKIQALIDARFDHKRSARLISFRMYSESISCSYWEHNTDREDEAWVSYTDLLDLDSVDRIKKETQMARQTENDRLVLEKLKAIEKTERDDLKKLIDKYGVPE
jgi:hypothetical protein